LASLEASDQLTVLNDFLSRHHHRFDAALSAPFSHSRLHAGFTDQSLTIVTVSKRDEASRLTAALAALPHCAPIVTETSEG